MAESTLSLQLSDLQTAVAVYLGYGSDSESWSSAQETQINRVVNSGYRLFLFPPAIEGIPPGHAWSFLFPVTTITTVQDDAAQDLPDDFDRLINGFTYEANTGFAPVLGGVPESRIRRARQRSDATGRPTIAAIRQKVTDGTIGQRAEVLWYPVPNGEYTLEYRYSAYASALTDDKPYPYGGAKYGEAIRAACLAAAEAELDDTTGEKHERFISHVASAIARDKKSGTQFFGSVHSEQTAVAFDYSLTVSGHVIQ